MLEYGDVSFLLAEIQSDYRMKPLCLRNVFEYFCYQCTILTATSFVVLTYIAPWDLSNSWYWKAEVSKLKTKFSVYGRKFSLDLNFKSKEKFKYSTKWTWPLLKIWHWFSCYAIRVIWALVLRYGVRLGGLAGPEAPSHSSLVLLSLQTFVPWTGINTWGLIRDYLEWHKIFVFVCIFLRWPVAFVKSPKTSVITEQLRITFLG